MMALWCACSRRRVEGRAGGSIGPLRSNNLEPGCRSGCLMWRLECASGAISPCELLMAEMTMPHVLWTIRRVQEGASGLNIFRRAECPILRVVREKGEI